MTKRFSMRRYLHFIGGGIGVAGIVFVVLSLKNYAQQIDLSRFGLVDYVLVALFALLYGAANVLLARAWWNLLAFLEIATSWHWALRTYGLSQLAKYVPGNIFHLAGRQALGMAACLPARPLAKSALWEIGVIVLAGTLISVLALPLVWPALSLPAMYIVFAFMSIGVSHTIRQRLSRWVAAALVWQMAFLITSGGVFTGTLALVSPANVDLTSLPAIGGAYVIAWLAGLVTPGAPAGVGVREIVLLFVLGGRIPQVDLLLAVVIGRIITVTGDLTFYFYAAVRRSNEGEFGVS